MFNVALKEVLGLVVGVIVYKYLCNLICSPDMMCFKGREGQPLVDNMVRIC